MKIKYALGIAAGLAVAGTAQAQSLTFNLSGYTVASIQQQFGALNFDTPGMVVSDISWNITYYGSTVSGSWANEMSIELVGPGAAANTPIASSAITGGWYAGTPGNNGTFIWGALAAPWNSSGLFNAGGDPNSYGWTAPGSTASFASSGSLTANAPGASLLGASGTGTWTLNIFDSYQDTGVQGSFGSGSFITITFVPTPSALALFGVAGAIGARRRRA